MTIKETAAAYDDRGTSLNAVPMHINRNLTTTVVQFIDLRIIDIDNPATLMQYRIKVEVPLVRLKDALCKRMGVRLDEVRLLYDDQEIFDEDTATSLGMTTVDHVVKVFLERQAVVCKVNVFKKDFTEVSKN